MKTDGNQLMFVCRQKKQAKFPLAFKWTLHLDYRISPCVSTDYLVVHGNTWAKNKALPKLWQHTVSSAHQTYVYHLYYQKWCVFLLSVLVCLNCKKKHSQHARVLWKAFAQKSLTVIAPSQRRERGDHLGGGLRDEKQVNMYLLTLWLIWGPVSCITSSLNQ